MLELLLPEGRIVCGHPKRRSTVTKQDPLTKQNVPVLDASGQPATESYFAVAIPKGGSADWKQTEWGQQIAAQAMADWPNGEHGAPAFAWKIVDGDSTIPNKVGKTPASREGWPGHWVMHLKTSFDVQCYHPGKYNAMTDQIREENAIKCGDYVQVFVTVKGNNPSPSPGIYINPSMLQLNRAGEPIVSEAGPDAASVFGGGAVQQPTPGAVQPNTAILNPTPEQMYNFNGQAVSESQLRQMGLTDEILANLPRM